MDTVFEFETGSPSLPVLVVAFALAIARRTFRGLPPSLTRVEVVDRN